jgi:hypothetical protein
MNVRAAAGVRADAEIDQNYTTLIAALCACDHDFVSVKRTTDEN